jgi:DNA-binding NarL/FixJ family response regulator
MLAYKQKTRSPDGSIALTGQTLQHEAESKCALATNSNLSVQAAVTDDVAATSLIAIVDRRVLGREVLTTALAAADEGFSSRAYADISEWLTDESRHSTSAIMLGIGTTSSDDPDLSADLQDLAQEHSQIPVIVMGDNEKPSHIAEILSDGVRGYIPTSVSLSVAIGALSLAIAGGVFVPASALLDAGRARWQPPPAAGRMFGLTACQAAVAEGVARGKPNKIIAHELNLSESTVKVHLRDIMKKLQARNRTEVAFKLHESMGRHE